MIIGILIIIAAIIAIWYIVTYNGFIKMRNRIEEAFSTMDVYLKKRWDLVPNLVTTVKAYAAHESETLERMTAMRTKAYEGMSLDEKRQADQELSAGISRIIATAEGYPELKSNENFMQLNQQLSDLEDDIANSRKYYNAVVRDMNTKVESFPSSIVAKRFYFQKWRMFEVTNQQERENVKVEF